LSCLKKWHIILFQIINFVDLEKSYKPNDLTLLSYTDNAVVGDKWSTNEFEYYRNLYASSRNEYIVTEASRAPKNYLRLVLYVSLKQNLNFMNQSQKTFKVNLAFSILFLILMLLQISWRQNSRKKIWMEDVLIWKIIPTNSKLPSWVFKSVIQA